MISKGASTSNVKNMKKILFNAVRFDRFSLIISLISERSLSPNEVD